MQRRIGLTAAIAIVSVIRAGQAGTTDFYRSSFEGTDGGWTADADWDPVGDWERGVPVAGPFADCSFGEGPGAAFDGLECWATQIDDCKTAVVGTSSLRQTFDFTTVVNGSLSWQQFLHIIGSQGNDRARVRINGDLVYASPFTNTATDGYELQSVDLSPYNNLPSVEIVFEFVSVSSIRRPGWYVDDVRITSLVDPNPGDLGVLVEDDPDPVTTVGDPIVYDVTAVNHGDAAASNVVLSGTLDAATVFNEGLSSPEVLHDGSPAGGGFTVNIGEMPAFSAQTFQVGVDTTQLGSFSFNTSVSGDGEDPNPGNDSRAEKTVVTIITDLSVALTSDQNPAITGTPFSYAVEVANLGPSEAVSAAWNLTLPENVSFLGASEGLHDGSSSGGVVSGTIATLPAAASHAITVDAVPNAGNLDDLTASAQVAVTDPDASDPEPVNNASNLAIGHVASAAPFATPVFTSTGFDFDRKKPLATSEVPGLPGERFSFFARPHLSPDAGTWGLHAFLDTDNRDQNEVIVLVDEAGARTVIYKGVTPMPDVKGETVGPIRDKFSINDDGCYAIYADTNNFEDVVLKGCGVNTAGTPSLVVVARQGNPVPGEPKDLLYSFGLDEPNLANDGTVRFFARTQGAITPDTDKFVVETPDDGVTVTKLLQEGVSIPAGQAGGAMDPWDDWRREFSSARNGMYVTGDGLHTLLSGFTTGDSAMNDIVTFDDTVIVQEGVVIDPVFTSPVQDPDGGIYLTPNGDWYVRGVNADGTHWVVRNGALLAKTGDEIFPGAGERWAVTGGFPDGFTLIAADATGNYVIGGVTDAPVSNAAGFQPPPQAVVYNGERVLMRTGDPVDVDGDGLFDDEGFIGSFDADGAVLLADGSLVAVAFVSAPFPFAGGVATTTGSDSPTVIKTSAVRTGACCFKDGSCSAPVRIEECIGSGGSYRGDNTECEGDSDGDGVDDACRSGACCIDGAKGTICENGSTRGSCGKAGGVYRGDGAICQGDDDGDGVDDLCKRCSSATAGLVACDDGDFCTNDLCGIDGFCEHEPVDCDDGIPCTEDSCDSHEQRCVNDTTGCEVCIYAVRCLDGDCANCPDLFMEGQECQDVACPAGTCAGQIITTCGDANCCLELELVDCRLANGEPQCPAFTETCTCDPQPGACCLENGGCTVTTEAGCEGAYMGDGTTCDPVQACCDGLNQCTERAQVCCEADSRISSSGPCSTETGKCCESNGFCLDAANEKCCDTGFFTNETCAAIEPCCLGDGTCTNIEPDCCALLGGVPLIGEACSAPGACCMPLGCSDIDPLCCAALGGIPDGPEPCEPPQVCCSDSGACFEDDPFCCERIGGTPIDLDVCEDATACCTLDDTCEMLAPACCTNILGTPINAKTCETPTACCLPDDTCEMLAPACCENLGGSPVASGAVAGGGEDCTTPKACCTNNGCIEIDPVCCDEIGGTQTGADECEAEEACCFPDGTCAELEPACCIDEGGTPVGPGSICLGDGTPPDGVDNACQQACCSDDDTCEDLLPTICSQRGDSPGGPGSRCLKDVDGDGRDDYCRTPGDVTGDGVVNQDDHAGLASCLGGPDVTATGECRFADLNGDGTVDLKDAALLWIVFGP